MKQKTRHLVHGALIAAAYGALSYLQNLLLAGSGSGMLQFRVAEALCVLAFFTPAAIGGLTVGCLLANLSGPGALPLDFLVGSLATFLAAGGMYLTRKWTVKKLPVLGFFLPAVCNGLLVGWELAVHMGGGFWVNAGYVAAGETAVLLTLGMALYSALKARSLAARLFT